MQFFYDGQIRRYITQMVRLMSSFSVENANGKQTQVPVTYGDLTRQVANIIRDNSENKIPSAPRIAVYVTGLEMDRDRTSDSSFVSKVHVRERAWDDGGNEYLNAQGKNYTVERLMPSPYTLRMQVDIWATNTEQKLQILEQILVLFNPSLELQTTDNYVDWTSLTVVNMDGMQFSSRTIPVGVDSEIDVANLQLSTPIYITPPSKVKRLGVVTNIIANVFNENTGNIDLGLSILGRQDGIQPVFQAERSVTDADGNAERTVDDGEFPNVGTGEMDINADFSYTSTALASTYQAYGLVVLGNEAQLVRKGVVGDVDWNEVVEAYPGTYRADYSQIRLQTGEDNFIVGTFTINPLDNTSITINWDADTLPDDTVIEGPARSASAYTSFDYIIDPLRFDPNQDKTAGVRLLLLGSIGDAGNDDGADAWKNSDNTDFVADENDIVEWDGTRWHIVFDASGAHDGSTDSPATYMSNLNTGVQYKWNGEYWIRSYEGEYSGGTWHIQLYG
jgi:hypothetical protein